MIENKTTLLGFRATPSERKLIERQARKSGKRLSEYLRLCVRKAIEDQAVVIMEGQKEPTR